MDLKNMNVCLKFCTPPYYIQYPTDTINLETSLVTLSNITNMLQTVEGCKIAETSHL